MRLHGLLCKLDHGLVWSCDNRPASSDRIKAPHPFEARHDGHGSRHLDQLIHGLDQFCQFRIFECQSFPTNQGPQRVDDRYVEPVTQIDARSFGLGQHLVQLNHLVIYQSLDWRLSVAKVFQYFERESPLLSPFSSLAAVIFRKKTHPNLLKLRSKGTICPAFTRVSTLLCFMYWLWPLPGHTPSTDGLSVLSSFSSTYLKASPLQFLFESSYLKWLCDPEWGLPLEALDENRSFSIS